MLKLLCPLFILGFVFSCGKKEAGEKTTQLPPEMIESEKEEFLKKQEISCEPGTYCPDYVAKIVVFDKGVPRFCTGTLIGRSKLLTSSSCLPSYLRTTDVECGKDVHVFFNRGNRPADRLNCKSILQVSYLDGSRPEFWRDDVAVIELNRSIYSRDFKDVTRKGVRDGETYRFFGVEQSGDFAGIIRKEECEVVLNSYLNPLSSHESSPNVLLSGCSRKTGYRGAAILDNFPKIRGVLSDNSSFRSALESSPLLIKPLKDFVNITNFACAPVLDETSALNEQECHKPLDDDHVISGRARLLSDEERYTTILEKLTAEADSASKYYRISPVLTASGDRHVLSFRPACFKSVNSWLNSVKADGEVTEAPVLPASTLRKGIDSNGRAITQEVENKKEKYYLTFSGKRLFKEKLSDVFVSTDNTNSRRINGIKSCQ